MQSTDIGRGVEEAGEGEREEEIFYIIEEPITQQV